MNCDVASVAHSFRCMNKLNKYNSKSTVIVVYRFFFFLCVHLFVCVCVQALKDIPAGQCGGS